MKIKTLNDLLDLAIQHEISSQNFYRDSISKTSDQKVIHFLNSLVKEEEGHERILRSIKEMEIYNAKTPVDNHMLQSVQESHRIEIPELESEPSIEEILVIALKRETKAHHLFTHLSAVTQVKELQEIFTNLAEEELTHHKDIEKDYAARTGQMGYEG